MCVRVFRIAVGRENHAMYKIKAAMYENAFTDRRSPVGASSSEPTLQQQMADVIQKLQSDYDSLCAIERKKASDFEAKYSELLSTVETQKLMLGDLERKTLDVVRRRVRTRSSMCTCMLQHVPPGMCTASASRSRAPNPILLFTPGFEHCCELQMNTADKKFKEVTDHQIALQQEANSRREAVRAVSVAMQNSNLPTALRDALKALADSLMPTAIADEEEDD
jgi:hypothetical protein